MQLSDQVLHDLDEAMPVVDSVLLYAGVPGPIAALIAASIPKLVRMVATDGGKQLEAMMSAAEDAYIVARDGNVP